MTQEQQSPRRLTEWALTALAAVVVAFGGWVVHVMAELDVSLRATAQQVAVNRERLDQLGGQVDRRENRDDAFFREQMDRLDQRITKLEDARRTGR